jgi:hypothetical protein
VTAIGWLVAAIAAAGALALPFSRGAPFVLALTPFANAYGSAAATGLLLLRWAILEVHTVSISRATLRKVSAALIFLAGALFLSFLVADDLVRLASESVQWVVGVGLYCALLIGGRQPHERPCALGLIAGGAALAFAQIFMNVFEVSVDETAVMPFMISEGNNYAALYALVALVVIPAHPVMRLSTPMYLVLAALGVAVIWLQDSRAQTVIAGGVIAGVVLLRHMNPRLALATAVGASLVLLFVLLNFLSETLFSNSSILSLANFQTNYSNLERLGLMLHSFEFFSTHPLGAGVGSSSDVFPNSPFTLGSYPTPHNTFALMIVELGWWGFIAYFAGVAVLLRVGVRACLAGDPVGIGALTAVALSLIDAVFFNGSVSLLFWLLLAYSIPDSTSEKRARIPMIFYRTA